MTLQDYVQDHTQRGECQCGQCADARCGQCGLVRFDHGDPAVGHAWIPKAQPAGHTVDMVFFKVAAVKTPTRADFEQLTTQHVGVFGPCNVFDGQEHGFMELGGWLGDQGLALQYMALGTLLGVFQLLTPYTVLPADIVTPALAMKAAGAGFVTVKKAVEHAHPTPA